MAVRALRAVCQFCVALGVALAAEAQVPAPIAQWGLPGGGCPEGIATDPWGHVYVVNRDAAQVVEFREDGGLVRAWGGMGTTNGRFSYPIGIAVDSGGLVYVADGGNNRIQVFDTAGVYIREWAIVAPTFLVIDSNHNVYVSGSDRIQKFTSGGALLLEWGTHGIGPGQFDLPLGICFDAGGNLDVADSVNGRVQQFTPDGTFVRMWDMIMVGSEPPAVVGLAPDPRGYIYAADGHNGRVQVFSLQGELLTGWDVGSSPVGVARAGTGELFISDCGGSVFKFGPLPTSVRRTSWGAVKKEFR